MTQDSSSSVHNDIEGIEHIEISFFNSIMPKERFYRCSKYLSKMSQCKTSTQAYTVYDGNVMQRHTCNGGVCECQAYTFTRELLHLEEVCDASVYAYRTSPAPGPHYNGSKHYRTSSIYTASLIMPSISPDLYIHLIRDTSDTGIVYSCECICPADMTMTHISSDAVRLFCILYETEEPYNMATLSDMSAICARYSDMHYDETNMTFDMFNPTCISTKEQYEDVYQVVPDGKKYMFIYRDDYTYLMCKEDNIWSRCNKMYTAVDDIMYVTSAVGVCILSDVYVNYEGVSDSSTRECHILYLLEYNSTSSRLFLNKDDISNSILGCAVYDDIQSILSKSYICTWVQSHYTRTNIVDCMQDIYNTVNILDSKTRGCIVYTGIGCISIDMSDSVYLKCISYNRHNTCSAISSDNVVVDNISLVDDKSSIGSILHVRVSSNPKFPSVAHKTCSYRYISNISTYNLAMSCINPIGLLRASCVYYGLCISRSRYNDYIVKRRIRSIEVDSDQDYSIICNDENIEFVCNMSRTSVRIPIVDTEHHSSRRVNIECMDFRFMEYLNIIAAPTL